MIFVFLWFALSVIVAIASNTRGRSGVGWFLAAVFFSPLLAGLLLVALPRKDNPNDGGAIVLSPESEYQQRTQFRRMLILVGIIAAAIAYMLVKEGPIQ